MAYIQPNSTVEFFTDIGISPNYDDSIYFPSVSAKDTYFYGLTKITTVNSLSYIRENRGFIRVERPMSTMYNVGYMRYKNTNFENKWFYAFVKSVNYINNITTEVEFEMDVVMTWMGAFQLKQCFIERQHTLTDAIGANIVEENLAIGDHVCEGRSTTAFFGDYLLGEYATPTDTRPANHTLREGSYVPLFTNYHPYNQTGADLLTGALEGLVTKGEQDQIVALKLVPYHWTFNFDETVPTDLFTVDKPYSGSSAWSGFTPKNNKLYCYPYKYLTVQNCEGENKTFRYEYFNTLPGQASTGVCTFKIRGTAATPEIEILCYPSNYAGIDEDYESGLTMNNFPSLAWNIDGYKAYIAQRDSTLYGKILGGAWSGAAKGAIGGAVLGGLPGAILGEATGGITGAISGGSQLITDKANEIAHTLSGDSLPVVKPNETRGTISSNLMAQIRAKNFYFTKMCITKEYAQIIDNYFDMFGYAIKQHGIPNMHARPFYTYVKTKGCIVHGNLPTDDAKAIETVFDHGIRFWNQSHTNIGNYNVNNAPS